MSSSGPHQSGGSSSNSVQHGAALQTFNNELVRCLDELCERRNNLQKKINDEEKLKAKLERQTQELQAQLDEVNGSLEVKLASRDEYDRTISESERAYMKILESSQVLLNVVKSDAKNLEKKVAGKE